MAARKPTALTVRTYDVGFGDCFLLTFHYASRDRHLLIDFGTMRLPEGKVHSGSYMNAIAAAIREDCGGRLDAVVATHRHQDHISGFARQKGRGPGEIIRALKPRLVVQPWTEDPRAATDATRPTTRSFAQTLHSMQTVAAQAVASSRGWRGERLREMRAQVQAIGMDNIANADAVANLMTMAERLPNGKPNVRYVHHGSNAGLARLLPGVETTVLGPPTVEQTDTIKRQRSTDPDEFWHLSRRFWARTALTNEHHHADAPPLFPKASIGTLPRDAGWFRYTMAREQAESLLSIVRMLDKAMNNTSVILLFQVADTMILFPGDAQYENWMYALSQPRIRERLQKVNVYKVGHHGSLNATPKTLWRGFENASPRSQAGRLRTFLSTKDGVHGDPERKTEVPRSALVNALHENSELTNTQQFRPDELRRAVRIPLA